MTEDIRSSMIQNVISLQRSQLLSSILNVGKDINFSCGYPTFITIGNYRGIYDREGVAQRVVGILPEGSWATPPRIVETEEADETEFEKEWNLIQKKMKIFHYLKRTDILSGIGRFGVLLLGLSDGLELEKPAPGIDLKTGEKVGNTKLELLYLRAFDEDFIEITDTETDVTSPRFGYPTMYSLQFEDSSQLHTSTSVNKKVHWTRVIHVADNRETSEVYGVPRMKPLYNRLLDIRKILSGSGEMFWRGAFPGYALEINPEIKGATFDTDSVRKEFQNYADGLQRYIALEGISVKSLQPQVSSPQEHLKAQLEYIALTIGVPLRIFIGSEQAKLASTQDKSTWNDRLATRQNEYVGPMILMPMIDRLIAFGILPEKEYTIVWPDLNVPSDKDKADVGKIKTEALASYMNASVDSLIPPKEFLMIILGMKEAEAAAIEKAAGLLITKVDESDDDADEE